MIFRGQAAEDSSRANETIVARDNEINTLRTTVQSVICHSSSNVLPVMIHDMPEQRTEDNRRANETIEARNAEINELRASIESVPCCERCE
jgi:hypothetical protein